MSTCNTKAASGIERFTMTKKHFMCAASSQGYVTCFLRGALLMIVPNTDLPYSVSCNPQVDVVLITCMSSSVTPL